MCILTADMALISETGTLIKNNNNWGLFSATIMSNFSSVSGKLAEMQVLFAKWESACWPVLIKLALKVHQLVQEKFC